MSVEIKDWLDLGERIIRANAAKELIVLANHGGGFLLFGFRDLATGWEPSGSCPFDIARYSQDSINDILKRHAEPPFECFVHHMASAEGTTHVVVEVPGGHTVPRGIRGSDIRRRRPFHVRYERQCTAREQEGT
jgi:predicted HTH transcriptional regulator